MKDISTVTIKGITIPLAEEEKIEEMKQAYLSFAAKEWELPHKMINSAKNKNTRELWHKASSMIGKIMGLKGGCWPVILRDDNDHPAVGWLFWEICGNRRREYFVYTTPSGSQAMQIKEETAYMSYDEMRDYCHSKRDADGLCWVCDSCSGPSQSNLASDYPCPENVKRYRGGHWGDCFFEIWVGDEQ